METFHYGWKKKKLIKCTEFTLKLFINQSSAGTRFNQKKNLHPKYLSKSVVSHDIHWVIGLLSCSLQRRMVPFWVDVMISQKVIQ